MRGGSVSAAATALAMSAVVWHFAAPQWTLRQLHAAAEARDAVALAEYVDFPTLRDSLERGETFFGYPNENSKKGFEGIGHGPSKPKSSRALMQHNLDWFDKYIFGVSVSTDSPLSR